MKKFILFFALLLIGTTVSAQDFVKASDVTVENFAKYLQTKKFKILEKTADFLKIESEDGYPLYLDFDKDKKYIMFNINDGLKDTADEQKKQTLLEKISKLKMIKAVYFQKSNTVQFEYYFWVTGGFSWASLEDAINEFYLYEGDAFNLDTDKIFK